MIHLDTSFLTRALLRDSPEDRKLREWLGAGTRLAISAIGWAEFLCGPMAAQDIELAGQIIQEQVPFEGEDATLCARLFNLSGRRRGSLTDCMIAATAVRLDAPLATSNPQDFHRLEAAGLEILTA